MAETQIGSRDRIEILLRNYRKMRQEIEGLTEVILKLATWLNTEIRSQIESEQIYPDAEILGHIVNLDYWIIKHCSEAKFGDLTDFLKPEEGQWMRTARAKSEGPKNKRPKNKRPKNKKPKKKKPKVKRPKYGGRLGPEHLMEAPDFPPPFEQVSTTLKAVLERFCD